MKHASQGGFDAIDPANNLNLCVDVALHATLKITLEDRIYESQIFDYGNPPKELNPLIDKLFSALALD